jgi:hypothetical protein
MTNGRQRIPPRSSAPPGPRCPVHKVDGWSIPLMPWRQSPPDGRPCPANLTVRARDGSRTAASAVGGARRTACGPDGTQPSSAGITPPVALPRGPLPPSSPPPRAQRCSGQDWPRRLLSISLPCSPPRRLAS